MFEGKYTTMGSRSTLHPRVVRGQLNRNLCKPWEFRHHIHSMFTLTMEGWLGTVMSEVEEEISDAFNDSWPACDGMKFLQSAI